MAFGANVEAGGEIAAERAMHQCKHPNSDGAGCNAEPANQFGERHRRPQDPFRPDQISPQHGDSSQTSDYSQSDAPLAFNPADLARLKRLPVAVDPHGEGSEEDCTQGDAKRRVDVRGHRQQSITEAEGTSAMLKSLAVRRMRPLGVYIRSTDQAWTSSDFAKCAVSGGPFMPSPNHSPNVFTLTVAVAG